VTGLLLLLAGSLAGITWWRLLKGKELARHAAAAVCRQHGLVLIDDTVMLHAVQLKKEDPVRAWGFRYHFSFAQNGVLQRGGTVLIAPGHAPTVVIEKDGVRLIEQL
jgi:hypothetical protein